MATIANQIKRISDSRDLLRSKGKALGLYVPAGNYWDDATNQYSAYAEAALTENDQIDKIAAAFNNIVPKLGTEIRVPITVRTDGNNTEVQSTVLEPGFYSNATIIPYVRVEEVEDIVINVEMVANRELTAQTAVINPSEGFNYIGQFGYTIVDGALSSANEGFGDDYVIAKVAKSGWLDENDTQRVSVTKSEMTSKVGDGAVSTINSGAEIVPSALGDTTLTITKGLFGSDRTLVVKSVASQTGGSAVAEDILDGKTAWVGGVQVTGTMPNYGGTAETRLETQASEIFNLGNVLAIKPAKGYYNDYSAITTNIAYNPTRVFNTEVLNSVGGTDTMSQKTYYETIPAGYYAEAITRKIVVDDVVGAVEVDYTEHKATFAVAKPGWIESNVEVDINAGPATYAQTETDLASEVHMVTVAPAANAYLTQVTIDNTLIFDLLSAI